jgi:hypothetical protein
MASTNANRRLCDTVVTLEVPAAKLTQAVVVLQRRRIECWITTDPLGVAVNGTKEQKARNALKSIGLTSVVGLTW